LTTSMPPSGVLMSTITISTPDSRTSRRASAIVDPRPPAPAPLLRSPFYRTDGSRQTQRVPCCAADPISLETPDVVWYAARGLLLSLDVHKETVVTCLRLVIRKRPMGGGWLAGFRHATSAARFWLSSSKDKPLVLTHGLRSVKGS
jgi:hypothetical protein